MLTKNIIWKYFRDFAQNHLQIGDFGYGDLWEISQSQSQEYCLMWVVPIPTELSEKQTGHRYTILVADREYKGQENRIEVESDTFQICLDIISDLDHHQDFWELEHSATITPFKEKFKDEVNGWMFDVILRAPLTYNQCQIPSSGSTPVPQPTCDPAQVLVNDDQFAEVASGSSINIFVEYESGGEVGDIVGGKVIIPDPIECEDAHVKVNGVYFSDVPSGGTEDIPVLTEALTPVGSYVGGIWVVPDAIILINGVQVDTEAPGSAANILLENTTSLSVGTVDGIGHVTVDDSGLSVNGNPFDLIPAEQAYNLIVKDTNGVPRGTKVGDELIVPAAEDATVKNSDNTYTDQVASGDTLTLPNIIVTDSDGNEYSWPAVKAVSCTPAPSPSGIIYQPVMPTRQYTSYDTNGVDDGGRIQSGFYNYIPPAYPENVAQLDFSVSNFWFRLKNNNIHGNKFRFTDFDGNQVFPGTGNKNAVFVDHLTGYMWIRRVGVGSFANVGRSWQGWIDTIDAFSISVGGNTYSDWYMPSREEILSICGNAPNSNSIIDGSVTILEVGSSDIWTSTTYPLVTGNAWYYNSAAQFANYDKTANDVAANALCFRKHLI